MIFSAGKNQNQPLSLFRFFLPDSIFPVVTPVKVCADSGDKAEKEDIKKTDCHERMIFGADN